VLSLIRHIIHRTQTAAYLAHWFMDLVDLDIRSAILREFCDHIRFVYGHDSTGVNCLLPTCSHTCIHNNYRRGLNSRVILKEEGNRGMEDSWPRLKIFTAEVSTHVAMELVDQTNTLDREVAINYRDGILIPDVTSIRMRDVLEELRAFENEMNW
jgi:hypothetical protein